MEAEKLIDMMNYIDYFYESIPSIYDDDERVIVSLKDGVWGIKFDIAEITTKNPEDIVESLTDLCTDLAIFHSLVRSKVCLEGVLNRQELEKIYDLVGEEAIDKEEENWTGFAETLKSAMDEIFRKSTLKLVD